TRKRPERLAGRVGAELAAGGRHRFTEDHEAPLPAQAPAHRRLLRCEHSFVEATDGLEGLSGREEETPAGEPRHAIQGDRNGLHDAAVERYLAIEAEGTAPGDRAPGDGVDRTSYDRFVDLRVGIDEHQDVAPRLTRAGVPGCCRTHAANVDSRKDVYSSRTQQEQERC